MSVLARNNWIASQRVDLPDLAAVESYVARDLRAFIRMFCGANPYIMAGMKVTAASGLDVTIKVADSVIFLPESTTGSFFLTDSNTADEVLTLPGGTTVYVEASFSRTTETSVTKGFWDETSTSTAYPAGIEYTASADAQDVMEMTVSYNTVGFSTGAVPIAIFVTDSASVLNYTNCRNMFFQVGTGGATPNPTAQYDWSTNRAVPPSSGSLFGLNVTGSPFQETDALGVVNDSAFTSFKDFHDALLTIIAEMRGVSVWYTSGSIASYVSGLSLNQMMFDSPGGHRMDPDPATRIAWSVGSDNKLRLEGTGPLRWRANYGFVYWELGHAYTGGYSVDRSFSDNLAVSATVPDGSNVYLALVREIAVGSGNSVSWKPATDISGLGWDPDRQVNGVAGDFTGVAVGDFIRKDSEGASKYYQVVGLNESGVAVTTDGTVATAACTDVLLDRDIVASVTASDPIKFFQQRYDASALVVDDATSRAAGTYNDALGYFWLGARKGNNFYFREYGMMVPEERREAGDDSEIENGKTERTPRTKTDADHSITAWQTDMVVVMTAVTTVRYITLPLLATTGMPDGVEFTISVDGSCFGLLNKCVVRPHATDVGAGRTIAGMPDFSLDSPYMSAKFVKRGTTWMVL